MGCEGLERAGCKMHISHSVNIRDAVLLEFSQFCVSSDPCRFIRCFKIDLKELDLVFLAIP